jgi:short-subunit dehydrogenase
MLSSGLPQTVLITGATGGIGGALAIVYAKPGNTLILQGRKADRLAELAASCEERGARVLTKLLDVRDRVVFAAWLADVSVQEAPDLVIVNAGVNTNIGPQGQGEQWADVEALVEVNVLAVMATVDAVLPAMRLRGNGQIALMSSLAGYFGLPVTPSYCASKAAVKAYGEALRGWLGSEGIRINVVMPGYVESAMCKAMPGSKPFLWTPERAARVIRCGLEANRARITFPFPLNLGTWFLAVLPAAISTRIVQWMGYRG